MTLIMTTRPVDSPAPASHVDLLILGAGWTSTFLIPLLKKEKISYAATSTTGREGTIKFRFSVDQDAEDKKSEYRALPTAKTILIVFPLKGAGETKHLVESYITTHSSHPDSGTSSKPEFTFIQLGSTGIYSIPGQEKWVTRHSKYDTSDARAQAEDELIKMGGCVLDLCGLWGGERNIKHWIDRVADTKEKLAAKGCVHMVHGVDVARAIIGVHRKPEAAKGERWMVTDLFDYDWWSLILGFAGELDQENGDDKRAETQIRWIGELMEEQGIRSLPRSVELIKPCYDAREFWRTFEIMPTRARLSSVRIGGQY